MSMRWVNLVTDTPERQDSVRTDSAELGPVFDAVRAELGVRRDFPPGALAEAHAVQAGQAVHAVHAVQAGQDGQAGQGGRAGQAMATHPALPSRDETSLPFLTIGGAGSGELDQALLIERAGRGYRVRYAIADVTAFVRSGGELDLESLRRGQGICAPDGCAPLYPEQLSANAASLRPGQVRPAFVWDVRLEPDGEGTSAEVYRAMISSREALGFVQAQEAIDAGTTDERLSLLREVGRRRMELERARGGASLPIPLQEIRVDGDGSYDLALRPPLPVQDWTVQISLMIGIAAAEMMLHAEVGILRTMPEPDRQVIRRFRRQARALGVTWPAEMLYGELLRSLDRANPRQVALMHEAAWLFRGAGAGYAVFDGGVPEVVMHEAVAAPYAHVTAPLRRVVDRYGLVICESICRDEPVPEWVRKGLHAVPAIMTSSDHLADAVERACAEAVTAAALRHRVGESFAGTIVDVTGGVGLVQLRDPLILAPVVGECTAGADVIVRLTEADVARRTVRFEVVGE